MASHYRYIVSSMTQYRPSLTHAMPSLTKTPPLHYLTITFTPTITIHHLPPPPHLSYPLPGAPPFIVKSVNFMGGTDNFIVSGSDCGNIFIWDKLSRVIVQVLKGDQEIVCITCVIICGVLCVII